MTFPARLCALTLLGTGLATGQEAALPDFTDLDAPEHTYWQRPLNDPLTRFLKKVPVDFKGETKSEKEFLKRFLKALKVPASSQILLFSKTSLQLNRIQIYNPRALYFNEELSVGYIPGGKIEVASVDPDLGAVFHIFDVPERFENLRVERSTRCMNCHADEQTHFVPGFVTKSVIPGPNGGSLDGFRSDETGHHIPLADRFGGYYLTGAPAGATGHANLTGRFKKGEILTTPLRFGERFSIERYLAPGSDLLAHLIREHQTGFTNRVVKASYLTRTLLQDGGGKIAPQHESVMDETADELVRYLLFAREASLPKGGAKGEATFRKEFLARKLADTKGRSLRDFDLKTRLFRYRCSYMIHSRVFAALPKEMKSRTLQRLSRALSPEGDALAPHLAQEERKAIREILHAGGLRLP